MSFQGFTEQTLEYFVSISFDNTKSHFEDLRACYQEHVKTPLYALYEDLVPTVLDIDQNICVKRTRCVSGAYNDARFSRSDPIKTYMYLHFLAETGRETDIPGFFMDASYDGYRCGLQLYHRSTPGMARLRDFALDNEQRFSRIIQAINAGGVFALEGERYKKDRYPSKKQPVNDWLNRKSWWLGRTNPPDEAFFSPNLAAQLGAGFRSLQELYRFMSDGLMN